MLGEFSRAFDAAVVPYLVNRGRGFYETREVNDLVHLLRVISNLVLNAADSIEDSGKIQIRVRSERLQTGRDGIERIEPGTYAVLEVTDTGSGIPPEHLPRILEPFFTTKRRAEQSGAAERSGRGLGLAIVQRIVKDALGFIDIQSRLGEGTTFYLRLPVTPPPAVLARSA